MNVNRDISVSDFLASLLHLIKNNRLKLALSVIILGSLGIGVIALMPNQYRSKASLLPSAQQASLASNLLANPLLAGLGASDNSLSSRDIVVTLLKSDLLKNQVLEDKKIADEILSSDVMNTRETDRSLWERRDFPRLKNKLNSLVSIQDTVKGPIYIVARTEDPDFSANLVTAYVNSIISLLHQKTLTQAKRKREFVESLLEERKSEFENIQTRLMNFDGQGNILNLSPEMIRLMEKVSNLIRKQATMEMYRDFISKYSPDSESMISEMTKRIEESKLQTSDIDTKNLAGSLGLSSKEIRPFEKIPVLALEYHLLKSRAQAFDEIILMLNKELELAKIEEVKEEIRIEVLDQAHPVDDPVAPRRAFLMLGWLVISFAASLFWLKFSRDGFRFTTS